MAYTLVRIPQSDGTEVGSLRSLGIEQFQVDPTVSDLDREMFCHLATDKWLDALNAGNGSVNVGAKSVTITLNGTTKTWTASADKDRPEIAQLVAPLMAATGWTTNQATSVLKIFRMLILLVMKARGL